MKVRTRVQFWTHVMAAKAALYVFRPLVNHKAPRVVYTAAKRRASIIPAKFTVLWEWMTMTVYGMF
jgi:hypothetical protein